METGFDSVLTGIGGPLDCVALDWRRHVASAMNSEPLELPPTLYAALQDADSIESVADDLRTLFNLMTQAIHTGGYNYAFHQTSLEFNGSHYSVDIFYRTNGYHTGDPFYVSDSFVVIDCHKVYAMQDNDNVAESGLFDTSVGFWLSPLRDSCDASLLDSLNDRLSVGYSSHPYGELESKLIGGVWHLGSGEYAPRLIPKTYWVESRRCYVCRVADAPYVCRVDPIAPYYGG